MWAFAHGMVMLELDHRFPADADLDAAWEAGIAAFQPAERGPRGLVALRGLGLGMVALFCLEDRDGGVRCG